MAGSEFLKPEDFTLPKTVSRSGSDGKTPELLPPSSFNQPTHVQCPSASDWKSLSRATSEIVQLKLENKHLKEKQRNVYTVPEEIRARVDVHQQTPYVPQNHDSLRLDSIIKQQASELAELKFTHKRSKEEYDEQISRFRQKEKSYESTLKELEMRLELSQQKHQLEIEQLMQRHEMEILDRRDRISGLEIELDQTHSSYTDQINKLETHLSAIKREIEETSASSTNDARTKDEILSKQSAEIQRLKAYVAETQEYSRTRDMWKQEKINFQAKIQHLENEKKQLGMSVELLNVRLASLNEVLTIQEKELGKNMSSAMIDTAQDKCNVVLTKWREKVFALLVQQKSSDIVKKRDEQNWTYKMEDVNDQLESSLNQCQVLSHSLTDRTAELNMEKNRNQVLQEELTNSQSTLETLQNKLQEVTKDQNSIRETINRYMVDFDSNQQTLARFLSTFTTMSQRVSFAAGRIDMLKGQFARKEALLKLRIDDGRQNQQDNASTEKTDHHDSSLDSSRYEQLQIELDRVTIERDNMALQIKEDFLMLEEKNQALKNEYTKKAADLEKKIADLESLLLQKNMKLDKLSGNLEVQENECLELRESMQQLKLDLNKQQTDTENKMKRSFDEEKQQLIEQLSVFEKSVNEARREHTKAVVAMRQTERHADREKQRHSEKIQILENYYKEEINKLSEQLKALGADRNLLMVTLKQEGLVGKYKSQRKSPVVFHDLDSSEPPGMTIAEHPPPEVDVAPSVVGPSVLQDLRNLSTAILEDVTPSDNSDT